MKPKIEEVEDIWSWRLKKSKIKEIKDIWSQSLETQPESATRVESRGTTDVGMPFGYPRISIPGPAHYGGGPT
jgi:hypothetical protein